MRAIKDWCWRLTARAGRVPCLIVTGLAGLLDVSTYIDTGRVLGLTVVKCSAALVAWAAWLLVRPGAVRRLPVLALLVGLYSCAVTLVVVARPIENPGTSWGIGESFSIGVLLFVAVHRGGASALTLTSILVGEFALLLQPSRLGLGLAPGMLLALIGSVWIAVGLHLRNRERIDASRLALARAEQRAELARDLHDFIAHHVTGIVVLAQGAGLVANDDPDSAIRALNQIEHAGSETMAAMRRMVTVLRAGDDEVDPTTVPGLADLPSVVEIFSAGGGPPVRLQITGGTADLPVKVSTTACRVVMESLTNVRRHAREATRVDVAVDRTRDALLVRVADDGASSESPGPADDTPAGFGLQGLTERVTACGGHLRVGPVAERGWAVEAAMPLCPSSLVRRSALIRRSALRGKRNRS